MTKNGLVIETEFSSDPIVRTRNLLDLLKVGKKRLGSVQFDSKEADGFFLETQLNFQASDKLMLLSSLVQS